MGWRGSVNCRRPVQRRKRERRKGPPRSPRPPVRPRHRRPNTGPRRFRARAGKRLTGADRGRPGHPSDLRRHQGRMERRAPDLTSVIFAPTPDRPVGTHRARVIRTRGDMHDPAQVAHRDRRTNDHVGGGGPASEQPLAGGVGAPAPNRSVPQQRAPLVDAARHREGGTGDRSRFQRPHHRPAHEHGSTQGDRPIGGFQNLWLFAIAGGRIVSVQALRRHRSHDNRRARVVSKRNRGYFASHASYVS